MIGCCPVLTFWRKEGTTKKFMICLYTSLLLFGLATITNAQAIEIDPLNHDLGDVSLGSSESMIFDIDCVSPTESTSYIIELRKDKSNSGELQNWETSFFL